MSRTAMKEGPVERYLRDQSRQAGFLCLKFVSPARGGVPDRVVIAPAATVFVEVKRPGGKPDPRQVRMHAKLRRFGAQIYVVDDKPGVDELIEDLLAQDKNKGGS